MNFEFQKLSLSHAMTASVDALVVLWPSQVQPDTQAVEPVSRLVAQAIAYGDFELKAGAVLSLYSQPGLAARHVVVACSADHQPGQIRSAMQAAWGVLKAGKIKRLGLHVVGEASVQGLQMALSSLADASYSYTTTLSKPKARTLKQVQVSATHDRVELRQAVVQAQALVAGVELAKEWANRPANHATPTHLAETAKSIASGRAFKCEVLGPKEVAKLGMGAFMAVAQGAAEPLRFIVLRYNGAAATQAPVVLVGKGITFDSGGISMKPAAEMDEMKYDMGGAASVLGVFKALGELKPRVNVVGLIPATENMPDGLAVKPGDVVTSMSGQTIEILNTDAEGRLVLCDALTYAERFKPQAVIDIATLTGACVIALGAVRTGLFSSDDVLALQLQHAGEASGDTCWRMPLDDDYAEGLKSRFADVANVAGRAAGSVTAAKFLQRFTKSFAWAHLDIAGTAWRSGAAKGATGRPVGLLLQYLLTLAQETPAVKSHGKSKAAVKSGVKGKAKSRTAGKA
ncbi:leucyl aminopeptidase [Limnohabitans sp. Rim8]|uniref:leucyl aminopeptidase n=1 Tax=Limnohabitans sp. Rim8 TaxID=1100718 RepID=UPI0025D39B84|nr:leucyl aminopeptidase [Limnohabitans sp. Rim8]